MNQEDIDAMLAFVREVVSDYFEFNPDARYCDWCLWAEHDQKPHDCSLRDMKLLLERLGG